MSIMSIKNIELFKETNFEFETSNDPRTKWKGSGLELLEQCDRSNFIAMHIYYLNMLKNNRDKIINNWNQKN